ncbi:unnamed protein product [Closterium sp. NIES-64]|nr:unnamed protein product [Closterium sp. NIES-64]
MATPSVLSFDAEGRAIDFPVWIEDLQLYLLCDAIDEVSLFDFVSGAVPAPPPDADPAVRSKWATRDAAARLAVRRHLPSSERAHFSQCKTAQALYDAVVARYSSPSSATLSRLMLPFLFPDLAAFPTVADLVTHLRASDARYRAALPAEFRAANPPPMYITLYFLVTRLPESLRVVRDQFLSVCPTTLTVDLLEEGVLLPPCCPLSPLPLRPTSLVLSRSVRRLPPAVDAALARARGARGRVELEGAVAEEVGVAEGVGVAVEVVAGVEVLVEAVEAEVAAEAVADEAGARVPVGAVAVETGVAVEAGVAVAAGVGVARPSGAALEVASASSSSSALAPSPPLSSSVSGTHTARRCFGRLTDAWRQQFPEAAEIPRWGELSRAGVAIYDLDFDAILSAMYAVTGSDEDDCYRCFPPDPGIGTAASGASEAAALGASASVLSGTGESALSGTVSASASHTFTLDSGASRSFFRDRTTLTPLSRPVAVSLADPSGGPVLSRFSTVLPCPAAPSGTLSGLYLPSFSTNLRAAPHSSQFPPTEALLQTLHMDVWGPARVRGQGQERYFLLVVDDYSRYTTVFPLRSKGEVTEVLIDWIRAARLQLRQSFGSDFPELRLHSDRGGEFSSGLLRAYCPYAAHQINLHPRVSRPETSPVLLWTGKVGDASAFRVWGSRAFVRDLSADKLSPRVAPCVFLGFPPDAPGWQFYHPTSRRVLSSQDVTFDESVPYYRLFPYRTPSLPPPPLFLVPGPPPVDPLPPQGPAPSGVSQVDAVEPVEVTGDSGAAAGAEPGGAESGGAEPGGAEPGGAEPGGAEPGGAAPGGAEPGGAEPGGAEPGGAVPGGASSRREPLSPQELREWFARRWRRAVGAGGSSAAEGTAAARPGGDHTVGAGAAGSEGSPGAGAAEGVGAVPAAGGPTDSAPGAAAGGSGAAGGATVVGAPARGTGAVPAVSGVAARPRPYFVPLLQQVLGLTPPPPLEGPQPVRSQPQLQPASPLPAPSPYAGPTGGLTERREPASRPASPVRTERASGRGSRQRPPPVPGTHRMSLRPSTAPLRAPLPSPPASSLPALADPESDSLRAASPTVTRLLATVVTDPSFESSAASALVSELVDFAARCRLDYAASLVAESESACPPSVGGECALGTDVLEDRQEEFQCLAAASPHLASVLLAPEGDPDAPDIPTPRSYAEAIEGPYSSQWQAAMDAEMASGSPQAPTSTLFPLLGRTSQRQGADYFQTFSPTPKMTTLRVLLHVAAHRDYELHSLDFSTAFLQGSLHEEIWLRRPPGFTGSFPPGTQWSLRRPVYGLRQAPREWHDTLRTTLAALGFAPSTADPSLFLRTDTSLLPFYILVYVDDLVFATADTGGLAYVKSELQKRHTCTDLEHMAAAKRVLRYLCSTSGMGLVLGGRSPVVLTGHADASWADDQATQRSSQGYTFSLGSGSVSWRATRSSSVLGSSCEAEIYAGAMAAPELRWLTYLLTDLGEQPRSPPVLYVDNKAMLALCREQRLEHRTKHIALRYFLARELQQRGQLRLAYVASEANTADVFTKALAPCDHQRCCTQLGLVPVLPHLLSS